MHELPTPAEWSQFRFWTDGSVQAVGEGEPYSWLSDDYALVWASDEESALLQHECGVERAMTCSLSSPLREDTKAPLAHSSNSTEPGFDLLAACIAVEDEAARRCGLSDVLYETHVKRGYALILDSVPGDARASTEAALRERGFDPDQATYRVGDGECSSTGISERCCPCGRHL